MKRCSKCMYAKPLTEFYKNKATTDRLGSWCKQCERERSASRKAETAAYRQTESYRAAQRKYKASERQRVVAKQYAARAKAAAPDRLRARWALNAKKRSGRVAPPPSCQWCGSSSPLQAHHHDYSKPLDVVWLCAVCHSAAHRKQA